ncbi:aminoglycoside phosphotransferase family protein [Streptomyces sp. NPDC004111]|uniref:aminoglycoside phosphotransferase family protein n=1 Tax=Streptomyces sp. NPDC004111 TaxID=3364690 RepID=UPI0036CD73A0
MNSVNATVPADLLEIADALLPGTSLDAARLAEHGNVHRTVLVPGVAAVRVSRRPHAARAMPRRTELLRVVAAAGLPFAVPEPLTEVTRFGEQTAVAVSWIDGTGLPPGQGDPAAIGQLLRTLREFPLGEELRALLVAPREDNRPDERTEPGWATVLTEEVLPRLPAEWRTEGRRRLDAALALDPVPEALVHGDLGAQNVHWNEDGELVGVLDWDLAQAFDPAVDAALMAWHGWDTVRRAVDTETYRRARVWDRLFGVEHLVAVLDGKSLANADSYVEHVVGWLERNASGDGSR